MTGARFERTVGVVEASVDGERILLAPVDGRCHALNGTADRIWSLLDSPQSPDEIVTVLVAEFDVTPERCSTEVADAMTTMTAAGLVTAAPGEAGS